MTDSSTPIRVMHLIGSLEQAGAEHALLAVLSRLDRHRVTPVVAVWGPPYDLRPRFAAQGIPVIDLGARFRFDLRALLRLRRALREHHIAVLHTHLIRMHLAGRLAGRLAGTPCIVATHHNLAVSNRLILRVAERLTRGLETAAIAVSQAAATSYFGAAAIPRDPERNGFPFWGPSTSPDPDPAPPESQTASAAPVSKGWGCGRWRGVIPDGIEIDSRTADTTLGVREQVRQELGFKDEWVFIYVARLHPVKGHRHLLEAMQHVVASHTHVNLLIVGEGPLRGGLVKRAERLGIAQHVRFLGFRADVSRLLCAADAFVSSSLSEGFGLGMLEAMAAQLPLVATRTGAAEELIVEGDTGFLAPPGDSVALGEAMAALLAAPERARAMGVAGRRRAEAQFSLAATAEAHVQLYEALRPPGRRILLCTNTAWNLYNFRRGLMDALAAAGYDVHAAAPADAYAARTGYPFHAVPMRIQGTNPLHDILLLLRLVRLCRRLRPDALLTFTPKPNIYGALAGRITSTPCLANIAGLGAVFITESIVSRIVRLLYRVSQPCATHIFFQNGDDMQLFRRQAWVPPDRISRIPGSGVDLVRFAPVPLPVSARFRFLLTGRLLWDKGVGEYVEAARRLRVRHPHVECCLLGRPDYPNPAAVGWKRLRAWEAEGVIRYLGATDDVRPELAAADCVVLPSYREGVPRSLLEAMAMARPVITTDAVGCRDVVEPGVTGLLCAVRSADDLTSAMARMVSLPLDARSELGRAGRRKAEREFDVALVTAAYRAQLGAMPSDRDRYWTPAR